MQLYFSFTLNPGFPYIYGNIYSQNAYQAKVEWSKFVALHLMVGFLLAKFT